MPETQTIIERASACIVTYRFNNEVNFECVIMPGEALVFRADSYPTIISFQEFGDMLRDDVSTMYYFVILTPDGRQLNYDDRVPSTILTRSNDAQVQATRVLGEGQLNQVTETISMRLCDEIIARCERPHLFDKVDRVLQ